MQVHNDADCLITVKLILAHLNQCANFTPYMSLNLIFMNIYEFWYFLDIFTVFEQFWTVSISSILFSRKMCALLLVQISVSVKRNALLSKKTRLLWMILAAVGNHL